MSEIPGADRWALVVFTARETPETLWATLQAAQAAIHGRNCVVDVLVNGNPGLVEQVQERLQGGPWRQLRLWSIAVGDKANAWDQYLHEIWSGEALVFFIDGYVRLQPDALGLLGPAVLHDAHALGGSGVPSVGRTAAALRAEMLRDGGFHGNLCCLKGSTIHRMRARRIRLPRGLYRADSLVGGLLCFNLDPAACAWDPARIRVHGQATWHVDEKHWWRLEEWRAKIKRSLRQARGRLENEAVKDHMARRRLAPEALPATSRALVLGWYAAAGARALAFTWRHPLSRLALHDLRSTAEHAPADLRPQLQWQSTSAEHP